MKRELAVILIAAGASKRFGGDDKLLAEYMGKPLIAHALETYTNHEFSRRILVMRPDADFHKWPQAAEYVHVFNQHAENGMGTSIAAAMAEIGAASHLMIALADMPNIQRQTIAALLHAADTEKSIIIPTYNGRDGHPVVFARCHFAALAALNADKGGRAIIQQNPDNVLRIATDDAGVVFDIDTKDDLKVANA